MAGLDKAHTDSKLNVLQGLALLSGGISLGLQQTTLALGAFGIFTFCDQRRSRQFIESRLSNQEQQMQYSQMQQSSSILQQIETVAQQVQQVQSELTEYSSHLLASSAPSSEPVADASVSPQIEVPQDKSPEAIIFIDSANIDHSCQDLGQKLDYPGLVSKICQSLDVPPASVQVRVYIGTLPNRPNQQRFFKFLESQNMQVVTKPAIRRPNGYKANFDVEIATDMRELKGFSKAVLVSSDGDFTYAVKSLQRQDVEVTVVGLQVAKSLKAAADHFISLTDIADDICRAA
jgi:uncharacterized LabA/DUF88 family protein